MRISDWSSDVCSSDLLGRLDTDRALYLDKISGRRRVEISSRVGDRHPLTSTGLGKALLIDLAPAHWRHLLDRKSVVSGKSVSVRVALGGRRIIKTQNIYSNESQFK